jgi:hypothetical protein
MLLAAGGDRFERLLLPFSSNGRMVDRIVGAVVVVPSTVLTAS